ncbi:MAG: hypothetical protein JSS27_15180 [Planctomycetes bacterium]|nr:hypothetical protein [Planctomycetota bacterium]
MTDETGAGASPVESRAFAELRRGAEFVAYQADEVVLEFDAERKFTYFGPENLSNATSIS